jgi:WD40 repeat protein
MKFVKGRTLATRLRGIRTDVDLTPEQKFTERMKLLDAFVDICNAIAFAHSRGVIHRDIKPANIMLGDFGEALVLDWGLARVKEKEDLAAKAESQQPDSSNLSADLTMEGEVMGTPAYMAPEQAAGRLGEVDERSDIYALGAVLYEIVSGEPPYKGQTAKQVLSSVLNEPPREIDDVLPDVSPELAALVMRSLERKPEDRFQSARELAEQVQAYRDGRMLSVYRYSAIEIARRFVTRHRGTVSVGALALLLLITGGVYSYYNVKQQRDAAIEAQAEAIRQSGIAAQQATEAETQKSIATEKAIEAEAQKKLAEAQARIASEKERLAAIAADEAASQRRRAEEQAEFAKREGARAEQKTREATAALAQARSNLAQAHRGYASLAQERDEPGKMVVHLAAAHRADTAIVSKDELVAALHDSAFPMWRTRSFADLPARDAVFSEDGRVCAAMLHRPALDSNDLTRGHSTGNAPDIGIWDVASGLLLRRIVIEGFDTYNLLLNVDGTRLVAFGFSGTLLIWDVASGQEIVNRSVYSYADSPALTMASGADTFFTSDGATEIAEWKFADGSLVRKRAIEAGFIGRLHASADGRLVALAADGAVLVWDAATLGDPLTLHGPAFIGLMLPTTHGLVIAERGGKLRLRPWDESAAVIEFGDTPVDVSNLAASDNGKTLAVTTIANGWQVFDFTSGRLIQRVGAAAGEIIGASFDPAGAHLVLALKGEGFDVVKLGGGSLLERAADHRHGTLCVDISPDGLHFVSAGQDGRVMLRSVDDGSTIWSRKISDSGIGIVRISPDGNMIAAYSHDGVIRLMDAAGDARAEYRRKCVWHSIKFSPDGLLLSAVGTDGIAYLLNARSGQETASFALSIEGRRLLTAEFDPSNEQLWLLDNALNQWSWQYKRGVPTVPDGELAAGSSITLHEMKASADGSRMSLATYTGDVLLWEPSPFRYIGRFKVADGSIANCSFGTSARFLACGTNTGKLCFVDAMTGDVVNQLAAHEAAIAWTAVSPDGRNVVTAGVDGEFMAWRSPSFLRPETARLATLSASWVELSPDGRSAALACETGFVRLFDTGSLEPLGEVSVLPHWVTAMRFNDKGQLAVAHNGGHIEVFDVATRRRLFGMPAFDFVSSLDFDADGKLVVLGAYHGIQLREMRENAPVVRVVHIPEVSVIQLFPDRRRAVVSGYDCQPRVINLADGAELVLLDSAGVFTTPAISPDGRTIALAGDYGHVALFDADTGQRTRSLRLGTATAKMLQYLPDGERLLVVNEQASAGVYDAASGDLLTFNRFTTTTLRTATLTADARMLIVCDYAGLVERWSLRPVLIRHERLKALNEETLIAMAHVLAGMTLDGLNAQALPRSTGTRTWQTEDGQPPDFLRGELPGWVARLEGAAFTQVAELLKHENEQRAHWNGRAAARWADQFEGFRYENRILEDLTLRRVTLPPRAQDEDGNYVGEPAGMIDYQAWYTSRAEAKRATVAAAIQRYGSMAAQAAERKNWQLVSHYAVLLNMLEPGQVHWLEMLARSSLETQNWWAATNALEKGFARIPAADQPRMKVLWARNMAGTWDINRMITLFNEARAEGYTYEDWHLHFVEALEVAGHYKNAAIVADRGIALVNDAAMRGRLVEARIRCTEWERQAAGMEGFSHVIVTSVPADSGAERMGLKAGDRIVAISISDHKDFESEVYSARDVNDAWQRIQRMAREDIIEASVEIIRNGESLTLPYARSENFDAELWTLSKRD